MPVSILDAMRAASNDYSRVEQQFALETGQDLCHVVAGRATCPDPSESISVVIPSYNGHVTLPSTLAGLREQRYRNFEVIIVDDHSSPGLSRLVRDAQLGVDVTLVRLDTNRGQGFARNIGVECSRGDSIIFLDDDIRVHPAITYSLALRQAHTNNVVFVGFRENVDEAVFSQPGSREARIEGDWHYLAERKDNHLALTAEEYIPISDGRQFPLVNGTDRFKTLGHCRVIGVWDLANMVCGHSICAKRADILAAGGFQEYRFEGWGTEDLAFGALMIARGHFIVPALDWISFHLRHEGRHVTRAREREQLKHNFKLYREYIQEPVEAQRFPHHRLRSVEVATGWHMLELDE